MSNAWGPEERRRVPKIDLEWSKHLCNFSPMEVVELHAKGVITLGEIHQSGRHASEFGSTLKNYIRVIVSQDDTIVTGG